MGATTGSYPSSYFENIISNLVEITSELIFSNYCYCTIIKCHAVELGPQFQEVAWTAHDLGRGTEGAIMPHR